MTRRCFILLMLAQLLLTAAAVQADPPDAKYLFPAGGRRGTTVPVRIGGCNFHDRADFHLMGAGIRAATQISRMPTLWFEGPVIPQPASQAKEDYPADYANSMEIAADAPLGDHWWKASTSQGVTSSLPFVVGDLPEVVETELPGLPHPVDVTLPVTANGRIFPREDVDLWRFSVQAGQTVTCAVDALRLGSPLEARLELLDPQGRSIAESLSLPGAEAVLRFTAATAGQYAIKIHDIQFGGLQNYVYRLTLTAGPHIDSIYPLGGRRGTELNAELTGANLPAPRQTFKLPATSESRFDYRIVDGSVVSNSVSVELDDLEEFLESEGPSPSNRVRFPAILNGRILQAGEADAWTFEAKKGDEFDFEVRAARLRSPLDTVIQILDADQKQLAENDDLANGQTDSRLRFQAPADGVYILRLSDRLPDRGGPGFAYRVRGITAVRPEFELQLAGDTVTIERGKPVAVKLIADRGPGVKDDITLQIEGLPAGVTVSPLLIKADQKEVSLNFQAAEGTKVQCVPLTIAGKLVKDGAELVRVATVAVRPTTRRPDPLWLAVGLPTPFRFVGIFETKFMPRGSQYVRHYAIQRNGFEGPLEARLADQQGRHLQGVTGDPVSISPGQKEFDFTVKLQPFMEIGRTSRATLMVMGVVTDGDGSRHVVSYSSNAQNDQMIALVDPGRLAITLDRRTATVIPGQQVRIGFRLQRSSGLDQSTQVEAIIPDGLRGVTAQVVAVPAGHQQGQIELVFGADAQGPFLAPVTIRATTLDDRKLPVISDVSLELVSLRE